MSDYVRSILSEEQETALVAAITNAELNTSGELRINLEKSTKDAQSRAKEMFGKLEMHKTAEKNGVLFYLAVESKKLAIWAGEGIDEKVPSDFWESIVQIMIQEFKAGHFSEGLIKGIEQAGRALGQYFPRQEDDVDELSNEISKG